MYNKIVDRITCVLETTRLEATGSATEVLKTTELENLKQHFQQVEVNQVKQHHMIINIVCI